jgi:hypothetical protein
VGVCIGRGFVSFCRGWSGSYCCVWWVLGPWRYRSGIGWRIPILVHAISACLVWSWTAVCCFCEGMGHRDRFQWCRQWSGSRMVCGSSIGVEYCFCGWQSRLLPRGVLGLFLFLFQMFGSSRCCWNGWCTMIFWGINAPYIPYKTSLKLHQADFSNICFFVFLSDKCHPNASKPCIVRVPFSTATHPCVLLPVTPYSCREIADVIGCHH